MTNGWFDPFPNRPFPKLWPGWWQARMSLRRSTTLPSGPFFGESLKPMATLLQIKTKIAAFFQKTVADLTILGEDMGLDALNQAKQAAQLAHDFEFQRQICTLTVDGITGGTLSSAVLQGTATAATIKTIVDMGQFDENGNFRPVEWTSVSESLERQRADGRYGGLRYPTDGEVQGDPRGLGRLVLRNGAVFRFPLDTNTADNDYSVGIEAYCLDAAWTAGDVSGTACLATFNSEGSDMATYGNSTINGYPAYLGYLNSEVGIVIWRNAAGTAWYLTKLAAAGDEAEDYDFFKLVTTNTSPAGAYTDSWTGFTTLTVSAVTGSSTGDTWTTYADEYLLWYAISYLNYRFKEFVPRTEGNLTPPDQKAQLALERFIEWDASRFDRNRRHGR